jgi:predicted Zn-dependent protease
MIVRAGAKGAAATLFLCSAFSNLPLLAQRGLPPDLRPPGGILASPPFQDGSVRPEIKSRQDPGVVSADLLRHPINDKARRMLQAALATMKAGDHDAAIRQLLEALTKYPDCAAYAQSLLGVEYLRTDQFTEAVKAFEQAVLILPHDAVNRYNLGLSLVCAGNYERGEQEVRRALELDPHNVTMQSLLTTLGQRTHSPD